MKVPGKKECSACIAAEADLSGRSWTDVKNYVHNTLQTMRRRNNLQYCEGNPNRTPRNRTPKKPLKDTNLCDMTTVHPDHLRESADYLMPMAPAVDLSEPTESFSQELNPTYASLCSTSTSIVHSSQPLLSSFTALNATDTQVVPTFSPHNTTNALMSEAYSSENSIIMSMSPYAHSASNMPPPIYAPQDPLGSPMMPSFSTFNAPSTSVMPTFTTLSSPSSPVLPAFSTVHRNPPIASSFTPLNPADTSAYDGSPPRPPTTAQVVPTAHGPGVSERTLHALEAAARPDAAPPAGKPQKRIKRLWSEEEQAAVRRQLGDFCKLVKVPGKRDCDACLAAEPALNSRTWREVKYFVHNSIQSMRKRGQPVPAKGPEPETPNPNTEWDGPVYLSL